MHQRIIKKKLGRWGKNCSAGTAHEPEPGRERCWKPVHQRLCSGVEKIDISVWWTHKTAADVGLFPVSDHITDRPYVAVGSPRLASRSAVHSHFFRVRQMKNLQREAAQLFQGSFPGNKFDGTREESFKFGLAAIRAWLGQLPTILIRVSGCKITPNWSHDSRYSPCMKKERNGLLKGYNQPWNYYCSW